GGNRHARHWMYWSAEGMMIVAKGVIVIHHSRSFQSVQKSQSPAKRSLVMSAAAATTKAAVNQNMKSHFRSIQRYLLKTSALSSSVFASIGIAIAILSLLLRHLDPGHDGPVTARHGIRRCAPRRAPPPAAARSRAPRSAGSTTTGTPSRGRTPPVSGSDRRGRCRWPGIPPAGRRDRTWGHGWG